MRLPCLDAVAGLMVVPLSRSGNPCLSSNPPMECAKLWASGARSALLGAFTQRNRSDPIVALDIHPIERQHVKMNVETQSVAEALDQGNGTGPPIARKDLALLIRCSATQR